MPPLWPHPRTRRNLGAQTRSHRSTHLPSKLRGAGEAHERLDEEMARNPSDAQSRSPGSPALAGGARDGAFAGQALWSLLPTRLQFRYLTVFTALSYCFSPRVPSRGVAPCLLPGFRPFRSCATWAQTLRRASKGLIWSNWLAIWHLTTLGYNFRDVETEKHGRRRCFYPKMTFTRL